MRQFFACLTCPNNYAGLSRTSDRQECQSYRVVEYRLEFGSTFNVLKVETVGGRIPVGNRRTVDCVDVCLHE